jgi:hypothetical protein
MKAAGLITRRRALITGLASVGGLFLTRYPKDLPPTYGNLLRMGDSFTYAAHRTLLPGQSQVREYSHHDVTSFPATGTIDPGARDNSALSVTTADCKAEALLTGVCPSRATWPHLECFRSPI